MTLSNSTIVRPARFTRRYHLATTTLVMCVLVLYCRVPEGRAQSVGTSGSGLTAAEPEALDLDGTAANTGAFAHSVKFQTRPARGGRVEPSLSLSYRSDRGPGVAGVGWETPVHYIEQSHFGRAPDSATALTGLGFNTDSFSYVAGGSGCQLLNTSGANYRCRVQIGQYMKFEKVPRQAPLSSYWEAQDGSGTRYVFGLKLDVDSTDALSRGSERWYLTDIIDTNNNWQRIDYRNRNYGGACVSGDETYDDVVLFAVRWNNFDAPSAPTDIDLGLARCSEGSFRDRARYFYEQRAAPIRDVRLGITSVMDVRLRGVQIEARTGSGPWAAYRGYRFAYVTGPVTGQDLLDSVQVTGLGCEWVVDSNGALVPCAADQVLPPTQFDYSPGVSQLQPFSSLQSIGGLPNGYSYKAALSAQNGQDTFWTMTDFNGDGRRDLVSEVYGAIPTGQQQVGHETFVALATPQGGWAPAAVAWEARYAPLLATDRFLDVNGDFRPDLIDNAGAFLNVSTESSIPNPSFSFNFQPNYYFQPLSTWDFSGALSYVQANATQYVADCLGASPTIGLLLGCSFVEEYDYLGDAHVIIRDFATMQDLTGDQIADLIVAAPPSAGMKYWWVFPGWRDANGSGGVSDTPILWQVPSATFFLAGYGHPVRLVLRRYDGTPADSYTEQSYSALFDINGDGLLDYVSVDLGTTTADRTNEVTRAVVNVGNGFIEIPWSHPTMPTELSASIPFGGTVPHRTWLSHELIRDFNGDGLADYLTKTTDISGVTCPRVEFGTGNGFSAIQPLMPCSTNYMTVLSGEYILSGGVLNENGLMHVDDDGLLDYRAAGVNTHWDVLRADTSALPESIYADLLVGIDNGLQAGLRIGYAPSTSFENAVSPTVRPVVASITPYLSTGTAPPAATFSYSGGHLVTIAGQNALSWSGFETVERHLSSGTAVVRTFDVNNATYLGLQTSEVALDTKGCAYKTTATTFDTKLLSASGVVIVYPREERVTEAEYGTLDCTAGAPQPLGVLERVTGVHEVNDFGEVVRRYDLGDTGVTGDELCTVTTYAGVAGDVVIDRPSRVEVKTIYDPVTETCSRLLRATNLLYDGLPQDPFDELLAPSIDQGNLKSVEEELYTTDLSKPQQLEEKFFRKRYAYDNRGNQLIAIDLADGDEGKQTRSTFETEDALFATVLRVEGTGQCCMPHRILSTTRTYDRIGGEMTSETSPNAVISYWDHDPFGRAVWKDVEDAAGLRLRLEESDFEYVDTDGDGNVDSYRTTLRQFDDAGVARSIVTLEDAFGREVESRVGLGGDFANNEMVTKKTYGVDGQLLEDAGPYLEPGGGVPAIDAIRRIHFRDQRGRPLREIVVPEVVAPPGSSPTATDVLDETYVTRFEYVAEEAGSPAATRLVTRKYPPFDPAYPHSPGASEPPPIKHFRDATGRTVRVEDRNQNHVDYRYNALGNLEEVWRTLQYSGTTANVATYIASDALGRRTAVQDPDKGVTRYRLDAAGNPTRVWRADPLTPDYPTKKLIVEYDTLGRVKSKRSQSCNQPYPCDFDDHPNWTDDGEVNATYYYDDVSRLPAPLDIEHPGVGAANGNLIAIHEGVRNGFHADEVLWFGYDRLGRRTLAGQSLPPYPGWNPTPPLQTERPVYFAARWMGIDGKVHGIATGEGSWPGTPTFAGGSDPAGYTQHSFFRLEHDSAAYLKRVYDETDGRTIYEVQSVDPRGFPYQIEMADAAIQQVNQYGRDGRLKSSQTVGASGARVDLELKKFDGMGNVLEFVDNRAGLTHSFAYDAESQLLEADSTGGFEGSVFDLSYGYDTLGNLRSLSDNVDPSRSRVFYYPDDGTRPQTMIGFADPAIGTSYPISSERGNITSKLGDTYVYSVDDMLVSSTQASGDQVYLDYAGSTNRVRNRVTSSGVTVADRFYVADGLVVDWTQPTSPILEVTVDVGPVKVMKRRIDVAAASATDEFYATDHLGSVRSTMDDQSNELSSETYYPFGATSGPMGSGFGFIGHENAPAMELVDMGARFYDPSLGRFVSADSIVPDARRSLAYNRYAYAYNNPTTMVDRTGHSPEAVILVAALVGLVSSIQYAESVHGLTTGEYIRTVVLGTLLRTAEAVALYWAGAGIGAPAQIGLGKVTDYLIAKAVFPKTQVASTDPDANTLSRALVSAGLQWVGQLAGAEVAKYASSAMVNKHVGGGIAAGVASAARAGTSFFARAILYPNHSEVEDDWIPGFVAGSAVSAGGAYLAGTIIDDDPIKTPFAAPEYSALSDNFHQALARQATLELVRIGSLFTRAVVDAEVNKPEAKIARPGKNAWGRFGDHLEEAYLNTSAL